MLRRGAVHGIAGRLARLENRQAARCAIPLAIRRDGALVAHDGRRFDALAVLMAETSQAKPPLVIGPEMPGGGQRCPL